MLSACELRAPLCLSFLCKMERKKNIVFPSECSFMMYVNINFILSIVICSEYFEHFFMILFFLQLFLVCISNSKPFYHHSGIKTTQVLNRKFPSKSNFIQQYISLSFQTLTNWHQFCSFDRELQKSIAQQQEGLTFSTKKAFRLL